MIDPNRTAERCYEAVAKAVEADGFVKDKIITAIRDVIAGEVVAPQMTALFVQRDKDVITFTADYRGEFRSDKPVFLPIPTEHYTPIPWDAVPLASKKGGA